MILTLTVTIAGLRGEGTGMQHQVVIVGGGFAGVAAAEELARRGIRVLLIDKNNYHQFQPLLYQAATAQLALQTVARPLRAMVDRRQIEVKTATVASIDPHARSVTTTDDITYHGEILVIACGAQAHFFGVPGAAEYAFPLYSVDDAARLRSRLLGALDAADRSQHYIDRGALNIMIVGAGATGVETAGAVAESLRRVVPTYLARAVAEQGRVYLIDLLPTVLPSFSQRSRDYAQHTLQTLGVKVLLGVAVSEVRTDGVALSDGRHIPSRIVVWAGGLRAARVLTACGLPQGKGGRVDVEADLRAPGHPGVYVLGDAANIPGPDGTPLPQLASVAQQAGRWAARNIAADLTGGNRTPFVYRDKGILAIIGRGAAIAEIGAKRRQLTGLPAFLAWLAVHLVLLSGARERLMACTSWALDYLTRTRPHILVDRPDAYTINWTDTADTTRPR